MLSSARVRPAAVGVRGEVSSGGRRAPLAVTLRGTSARGGKDRDAPNIRAAEATTWQRWRSNQPPTAQTDPLPEPTVPDPDRAAGTRSRIAANTPYIREAAAGLRGGRRASGASRRRVTPFRFGATSSVAEAVENCGQISKDELLPDQRTIGCRRTLPPLSRRPTLSTKGRRLDVSRRTREWRRYEFSDIFDDRLQSDG